LLLFYVEVCLIFVFELLVQSGMEFLQVRLFFDVRISVGNLATPSLLKFCVQRLSHAHDNKTRTADSGFDDSSTDAIARAGLFRTDVFCSFSLHAAR
jgi:hypothetical protein